MLPEHVKQVAIEVTYKQIPSKLWKRAQKVAPIRVYDWETAVRLGLGGKTRDEMSLNLIQVVQAVTDDLVFTIEGPETRKDDAVICQGVVGELWQQPIAKVQKNYYCTGANDRFSEWAPNDNSVAFVAVDDRIIGRNSWWKIATSWAELYAPKGDILISRGPEHCYPIVRQIFYASYQTGA